MATAIYPSTYKDQPAVTLESGILAAQFLPGMGAKMASLIHKPSGFELLVQRPGSAYLAQPYAGDYVAGECSGFDDMFPTIDECFYPRPPWKGVLAPDHGEVWALAWGSQVEAESLRLAVNGVRFPYRLEKQVCFAEPSVLRIDYRLTNPVDFEFDFLWAAHIMLNLEEGARLILPAGVGKIVSRLSYSSDLGRYGDEFDWPVCTLAGGGTRDLRQMRPPAVRDAAKYFVKGRMPEGWCRLDYPGRGLALTLSFPADRVPYLGILPNEGGWQGLYNLFLEPGTASFDDLNAARARGECSTIGPRSTYEWRLDIALSASAGAR